MINAPVGIGHNEPPPDLFDRVYELVRNADKWIAERPAIASDEQAKTAQTFIDQLMIARHELERERGRELSPHQTEIAMIRTRYENPLALLDLALSSMRAKAAEWLQKLKQRLREDQARYEREARTLRSFADEMAREAAQPNASIEEQRAAQKAEEAAVQAERRAGQKPKRAQVKGDYAGRAMSLRTYWHARVLDKTVALQTYANNENVRNAALGAALKEAEALAKKAKRADAAPAGFEFYVDERAT